jgi:type IV pilus assembly protein PilF
MKRLTGSILVTVSALAVNGCANLSGSGAVESDSEVAELNLQLGMRYMTQGNFGVALEKLKKSLAYDENSAVAHNAIAVLYDETNQDTLAENHFQQAVDLDADFVTAKLNYAHFLCTNGKPRQGEATYVALAEQPAEGGADLAYRAYLSAAVCTLKIPDQQRADDYLRKALALRPNDANTLYRLADLYYGTGDYLKARAFLQRYHDQSGYNPESLWLGISIEDKLGDTATRQKYTQLLLSRFADSDVARRLQSQ